MRATVLPLFLVLFLVAPQALADSRPNHFQGEPAETLEQALSNLNEYNAKLAEVLKRGELSPADMAEIHRLTYTLENGLERLRKESHKLAQVLEALHLASESGDTEGVSVYGEAYLDKAEPLRP